MAVVRKQQFKKTSDRGLLRNLVLHSSCVAFIYIVLHTIDQQLYDIKHTKCQYLYQLRLQLHFLLKSSTPVCSCFYSWMSDLDGLDRRIEPEIKERRRPGPHLPITSSPRTNGSLKVLNSPSQLFRKICFDKLFQIPKRPPSVLCFGLILF